MAEYRGYLIQKSSLFYEKKQILDGSEETWKKELIQKYLMRLSNAFALSQHSKILVFLDCDSEIICVLYVLKEYLRVVGKKMQSKLVGLVFEPSISARRK